MASSWLRRRRLESWRRVAGSTYAEWLVENELASARTAGVILAIGLPVAVGAMFATVLWLDGIVVMLIAAPIAGFAVAILWYLLSRRRQNPNLPDRIADDLWTRDFAMFGTPSVSAPRDFLVWVLRNGAQPGQLESAARAPVVRERPERSAGRIPIVLRVSIALCLAGVGLLLATAMGQLVALKLANGEIHDTPETFRLYLLVVCTMAGGLFVVSTVAMAALGSRVLRRIATWQTLFVVVGVVASVLLAPTTAAFAVLAAGLWFACVALLWSRPADEFMGATEAVARAMWSAVAERQQAWTAHIVPWDDEVADERPPAQNRRPLD